MFSRLGIRDNANVFPQNRDSPDGSPWLPTMVAQRAYHPEPGEEPRSPVVARLGSHGHVAGTTALPPATDVLNKVGKCLFLTRKRHSRCRKGRTTPREKLIKIGAKIVRHGRHFTFQLAEVALPRDPFRKILMLIDDLRPSPTPA